MIEKFLERAKSRDPRIEANLDQVYALDEKTTSVAAAMVDVENYRNTAKEATDPIRDYMAREGVQ